jgi:predicted transposase/invertase (TIGR01784 family)
VEEAIKMDTAIQKAEEKMAYVTGGKEALRAYQMRETALSDWTSGLNHAREEGMEKGIREVARALKSLGDPFEKIARATGLSVEDIAKL